MNKPLTKCNFCRFYNGYSCMATPNSAYCTNALNEYMQHKKATGQVVNQIKSKRPWDKR